VEDKMELLGDAYKLSGLPTEFLKKLFQDQEKIGEKKLLDFFPKELRENYLKKWGVDYIFRNGINREKSLDEERFEPHPYIPIWVSNYGKIRYSDAILEEKEYRNGYSYINVPYEIERLRNERNENKQLVNKLTTPIVEDVVEYENEKYPINKQGDWPWHPCVQIGVTDNTKIINLYQGDKFGKIFKEKYNNGIKFVEIPIHIYRLVAETWLENPDYNKYKIVHHISNNGYDNSIYNLMWVTDVQHKIIENR
jgi:hypothetical protein